MTHRFDTYFQVSNFNINIHAALRALHFGLILGLWPSLIIDLTLHSWLVSYMYHIAAVLVFIYCIDSNVVNTVHEKRLSDELINKKRIEL